MNIVIRKRRALDTTAPTISDIVGVPGNVTWTTNEAATGQVEYGLSSSYVAEITDDAPVAWWRLGEASGTSAADEIGTATGTYVNTPTLGETGMVTGDTAVDFARASSEYVSMSTGIPAGSSSGASIEAFVRLDSITVGNYYTIAMWGGKHGIYYREYDASTHLIYWAFNDGTAREVWNAWAPSTATDYHVVVTHDYAADLVTYYVNGTSIGTDDVAAYGTPVAPSSGAASYIASYNGSTHYWDGLLDEVSFWDRALTSAEVAAHYAARTASSSYLYSDTLDTTLRTSHSHDIPALVDGMHFRVKSADAYGNLATSADQTAAETPPGGTLQDRIDAATAGTTLALGNEHFTAAATVNKALTITGGYLAVGAGTTALTITSSNVTIDGMTITGPQAFNYVTAERGIYCSTALTNVTIKNCTITDFGNSAIWLDRVTTGLDITTNVIEDCGYMGICICSCSSGTVDYNTIRRVGESYFTGGLRNDPSSGITVGNNAYGIALTNSAVAVVTSNVVVDNNTVEDVPSWHGLDTHAGVDCTFSNNTLRRCSRPIFITGSIGSATRVAVTANRIEGPGSVANNLTAITFASTINCSATGNAISTLYPSANQFTGGGNVKVYDYNLASTGLTVSGNTLI